MMDCLKGMIMVNSVTISTCTESWLKMDGGWGGEKPWISFKDLYESAA